MHKRVDRYTNRVKVTQTGNRQIDTQTGKNMYKQADRHTNR